MVTLQQLAVVEIQRLCWFDCLNRVIVSVGQVVLITQQKGNKLYHLLLSSVEGAFKELQYIFCI